MMNLEKRIWIGKYKRAFAKQSFNQFDDSLDVTKDYDYYLANQNREGFTSFSSEKQHLTNKFLSSKGNFLIKLFCQTLVILFTDFNIFGKWFDFGSICLINIHYFASKIWFLKKSVN